MRSLLPLLLFFVLCFGCKQKTDIQIRVFNPYLQANVKGAKVVIIELRQSNFFTSGWGKQYDKQQEIASAYTDENGLVFFDEEKLRRNKKYDYQVRLAEVWGSEPKTFDPRSYTNLKRGKTNNIIISDYTKGTVDLQFSNLFNRAQPGDSLSLLPSFTPLFDPLTNTSIVGEGLQELHLVYGASWLPADYLIKGYPNKAAGKVELRIRKRKAGLLSVNTLTVQFYPQQTTVIPISW